MGLASSKRMAREDPEIGDAFGLYPNGRRCFLCAQVMRDAADEHSVYWSGGEVGSIFLHARCAIDFGCHLIKDGLIATDIGAAIPREIDWLSDPVTIRPTARRRRDDGA